MLIREAHMDDIPQLQRVRLAVRENVLSDPGLITEQDYRDYLGQRGNGWVCEENGRISGFAIVDLKDHNVWALFVDPEKERQGIGRQLHDRMLDWYFSQTSAILWLSTAPGTRAEQFYKTAGWKETGPYGRVEIKMEMTADAWQRLREKRME